MNVIEVLSLGIVGYISGYFILEYFFFLSRPKGSVQSGDRNNLIFGALIVAVILPGTMWKLPDVLVMMIVCIVLTVITGNFNKRRGEFSPWFIFLSAALLNISSAYGMTYSVYHMGNLLSWEGLEYPLRVITMSTTLLGATGIVLVLRYSGIFPNDSLKDVLNDKKKSVPLGIFLSMFSFGNVSTIHIVNPPLAEITLNAIQGRRLYTDMFMKAFIILAGAYLTTIYLCNLNKSETKSENLHNALIREKGFRVNLSDNEIATFCVDLENDRYVEGEEFFDGLFDGFFEKDELPYSKSFLILMKSLSHPNDFGRLEHYLEKESVLQYMENSHVRNEEIRISRRVFELYMSSEAVAEDKENRLLGRTDQDIQDNEWFWINLRFSLTMDEGTGKHSLYILVANINERKKKELLLRESAEKDALTGLYNRAFFEDTVQKWMTDGIECGCAYVIDADHLKQVNDSFGHAEGDKMLIHIAGVLKKEFRTADIVARFGGDEFVIFAPGLRDIGEIRRRAERLNEFGRKEYTGPDGTCVKTSLSIGISLYPLHADNLKELFNLADKALYSVKSASRDSYKIFDQG